MEKMRDGLFTRTSCFAMISGIETDLRDIIYENCSDLNIADVFPEDVATKAEARFTQQHSAQPTDNTN